MSGAFIPYAVSWNVTWRCNLACRHCYMDANSRSHPDNELSTEKALEVIGQIASVNPSATLIFTGGEPLLRPDIFQLCQRASSLGLLTVLGTNGTLLTPDVCDKLKSAGAAGVGVSIDSLDAVTHDRFRGKPGALSASVLGLLAARDAGINIQVQTTPRPENLEEIPLIAEWAHKIGARVFNLFFLVCTGRGETMADILPHEYENLLKWAAQAPSTYPGMMIRPKCAPHFKRVLHQRDPQDASLKSYIAACRAGTQYCRIDPVGKVTPCPYLETHAGDLNIAGFGEIWINSPQLTKFRSPEYNGKCGRCAYRIMCGGCRARAHASTGDDLGEDQWCVYEPVGMEEPLMTVDAKTRFGLDEACSIKWSAEAGAILEKIPVFARPIVKLGAEKYANENGLELITPDTLRLAVPSPRFFADMKKPETGPGQPIPWADGARARVENAPEFVRPGILKLMQIRARERGKRMIDDSFLTEIRDESMMLVTRRMKGFGFDGLSMDAWEKAKRKFSKSARKLDVIDEITSHLDSRPARNETIMGRFASFFADDVGDKMGWTSEARARLEKAPEAFRGMAQKTVESFARKRGYKYVTEEALELAMRELPFGPLGEKQE